MKRPPIDADDFPTIIDTPAEVEMASGTSRVVNCDLAPTGTTTASSTKPKAPTHETVFLVDHADSFGDRQTAASLPRSDFLPIRPATEPTGRPDLAKHAVSRCARRVTWAVLASVPVNQADPSKSFRLREGNRTAIVTNWTSSLMDRRSLPNGWFLLDCAWIAARLRVAGSFRTAAASPRSLPRFCGNTTSIRADTTRFPASTLGWIALTHNPPSAPATQDQCVGGGFEMLALDSRRPAGECRTLTRERQPPRHPAG